MKFHLQCVIDKQWYAAVPIKLAIGKTLYFGFDKGLKRSFALQIYLMRAAHEIKLAGKNHFYGDVSIH